LFSSRVSSEFLNQWIPHARVGLTAVGKGVRGNFQAKDQKVARPTGLKMLEHHYW
jgi:hypothetical protein